MISASRLPNCFTVFRILLTPLIVVALWQRTVPALVCAGLLFSVAVFTDFYDGYLARVLKAQSWLGVFLDPLADKILVFSVFIFYWSKAYIPSVPLLIMLLREFWVTVQRFRRGITDSPMPASFWGKLKTVLQFLFCYFLFATDYFTAFFPNNIYPFFFVITWIIAIISFIGLFNYADAEHGPYLALATMFGCGYVPYLPGSVGSLAAVIIWLVVVPASVFVEFFVSSTVFIVGLFACSRLVLQGDPSYIVIDEVAGMMLVLVGLSRTPQIVVVAFLLFRLFDILKPWPISHAERIPGSIGIMLDDILAAVLAKSILLFSSIWL